MRNTLSSNVFWLTMTFSLALQAAPLPGDEGPKTLEPIVVVASKTERPLSAVAGQVTVIDSEAIRYHLAEGLDDLLRYEPGLNVDTAGTRFGVRGVNIRGIGGNRVAIEVDGVPVRDQFAVGSYSNGGRALVETDRVKRVEVLYGPASTLYGSDALGGVMAFTTWDPDDLLALGGGRRWLGFRGGMRGADSSWVGSANAAFGNDRSGVLLAATLRDGHELDHQAAGDVNEDLQDWDSQDFMLRFTHDLSGRHRLRFTVADYQRDALTEIHSILGFARFRNTTALRGVDHDAQRRLQADFEFDGTTGWTGVLRAFDTESETRQASFEERAAARVPVRIERYFDYRTDLRGLELNLFRGFSGARGDHRLGMGVEVLRTDSRELRDGLQQNLDTGETSKSVLGENLPVRDFPISRTDEWGVFIQDEIQLAGGRWELIPALRYERYELRPQTDAIFVADNPSSTPVAVNEDEITPRLGIVWHVAAQWSLYAQYVRGFRAPPFEDANIGLDIPLFRVRAIPNPDLKSETSTGYEVGVRQFTAHRRFSFSLFNTEYDDFIETRARVGVDPVSGYLLFQSRNIERARIYGADLRFEQDLGEWSPALRSLKLSAAAFWSEGDNRSSGQPLNSISPPQAVLGLAWTSSDRRWDAGLSATLTRAKDDIDPTGGERFATPGYGLVDLVAGYRHARWLEVRVGLYNLGDKRYWRWSDVAGFAPDDPMLELLSRPGRNYSATVTMQW